MKKNVIEQSEDYPAIEELTSQLVSVWPEHQKYISNSFADRDAALLDSTEQIAAKILRLAGTNLEDFCKDYRWTCERLLEEELFFRRNGCYRFSSLSDVIDKVYNNKDYMHKYLNGLLLSQAIWHNHADVFDFYIRYYLPRLPSEARHLEVGPGHGLFLYFATQVRNIKSVAGWDISQTAIDSTREALQALGVEKHVNLEVADIMCPPGSDVKFDSIVVSEVLEHIENPHNALLSLRKCLSDEGLLFVNVPVNSPAPDHIYLLKTPEESVELLEAAGYKVKEAAFFPLGGEYLGKST